MVVIRWVLGRIILFFNFIFAPKKKQRPAAAQSEIDGQTKLMQLYQYPACPFCVKVRRAIRRQGLNIETINAKQPQHQQTLVEQGGKSMVPCLRIEQGDATEWLYESTDIIRYLEQRFS